MARWAKLPEWTLDAWHNQPVEWTSLAGSPVMVLFFHRRCDGCVSLALPQAELMHRDHASRGVRVVALHSALGDGAGKGLPSFLAAGGYTLPVAVDAVGDDWKPRTMHDWAVDGTPTLVLLDKRGQLRLKKLGHMDDTRLSAALEQLLAE